MSEPRERLILPVAVCVLLGWVAALTYAMIEGEYTPLTVVTPLMLLLAGYAFGTSIVRGVSKGDRDA
jgi:hypothetical protein